MEGTQALMYMLSYRKSTAHVPYRDLLSKIKKYMFKTQNSIISFIFSFVSLALLLDYFLSTRTIKVNESIGQEITIKIVAVFVFLLVSLYFRKEGKKNEMENGWLKASGIMNIVVVSVIILAFLFYLYIEITKK